jgi:hypothetical protein
MLGVKPEPAPAIRGGLRRAGEAFDMGEIEIGVREGAGIAPGAGMDVRRPHESA